MGACDRMMAKTTAWFLRPLAGKSRVRVAQQRSGESVVVLRSDSDAHRELNLAIADHTLGRGAAR